MSVKPINVGVYAKKPSIPAQRLVLTTEEAAMMKVFFARQQREMELRRGLAVKKENIALHSKFYAKHAAAKKGR